MPRIPLPHSSAHSTHTPTPSQLQKVWPGAPHPEQNEAQPRLLAPLPRLTFIAPQAGDHPTKTLSSRSGPLPARGPGLRVTHRPYAQSPHLGRGAMDRYLAPGGRPRTSRTRPVPHFPIPSRPQPGQDPARPRDRPARLLARPSEHLARLVLLQAAEAPHYQALQQ